MAPINRRLPLPTRRRALELLSDAGTEGCSEAVMLAHGFTVDQLTDLVRIGLATATPQPIVTGRGRYEIPILRITEAGRKALEAGEGSTQERGEVAGQVKPSRSEGLSPNKRESHAPSAEAELDEILKARPDLKGKSLEAAKRIMRRARRLSLKPRMPPA